jgi:hypothetical protein
MAYSPSYSYNVNPGTQSGSGAFGSVPGALSLPNPYADLSSVYPNLAGTNAAMSNTISAQLGGQLSPGTLSAMQDYEAQFAAGSGMPGTNARPGTLMYNRGVRDIGTTAEAQVQAGQKAYNQTIPTISGTQTVSPALQTEIAGQNALNASAPNPTAANSYAQQLYNQYLSQTRGPGGGTRSMTSPAQPQVPVTWASDAPNGPIGYGPGGGPGQFQSPYVAPTDAQGYYKLPTGNTVGWSGADTDIYDPYGDLEGSGMTAADVGGP